MKPPARNLVWGLLYFSQIRMGLVWTQFVTMPVRRCPWGHWVVLAQTFRQLRVDQEWVLIAPHFEFIYRIWKSSQSSLSRRKIFGRVRFVRVPSSKKNPVKVVHQWRSPFRLARLGVYQDDRLTVSSSPDPRLSDLLDMQPVRRSENFTEQFEQVHFATVFLPWRKCLNTLSIKFMSWVTLISIERSKILRQFPISLGFLSNVWWRR